jgi:NADH-quinone oxidoreductase subunit N
MYFDDVDEPLDRAVGRGLRLVMLGTSVVILLFFLYPEPILSSAEAAAAALFPG